MTVFKKSAILAALLLCFAAVATASGFTVFVKPLEVFNSPEIKEMAPGLRSMIASRIAGQGYSVSTEEGAGEASFALRTTVTRIGGLISVDSELTSMAQGVDGARAYETSPNVDGLAKALEKITDRIKNRLSQVPADLKAAANAPSPVPLDRHPPLALPVPAAVKPLPAAPAAASEARGIKEQFTSYREVATVQGEARALVAADVDGDAAAELILLVEKELHLYKETETGLSPFGRASLEVGYTPLSLSAADVDGDKAVEIFVAGNSGSDVYTQAFQYQGGKLVKKGPRFYGFLKTATPPGRGPGLVGMKSLGGAEVFSASFRYFTFDGKEYSAGEKLPAPQVVQPVNTQYVSFAPGQNTLMLIDGQRRLRLYDEAMNKLYVSEEMVGGSKNRVDGEIIDTRYSEPGSTWEINQPAVMWNAPDGNVYAILPVNISTSLTPKGWGSFEAGKLSAFKWDGMAFSTGAETPRFPGFFAGLARGGDGQKGRLYAVLVKSTGVVFRDYSSHVLAFEL